MSWWNQIMYGYLHSIRHYNIFYSSFRHFLFLPLCKVVLTEVSDYNQYGNEAVTYSGRSYLSNRHARLTSMAFKYNQIRTLHLWRTQPAGKGRCTTTSYSVAAVESIELTIVNPGRVPDPRDFLTFPIVWPFVDDRLRHWKFLCPPATLVHPAFEVRVLRTKHLVRFW